MRSVLLALAAASLIQDPTPAWEDRDFGAAGFDRRSVGSAGGAAVSGGDLRKVPGSQDVSEHDVISDFSVFQGRLFAAVCFQLDGGMVGHSGYSSGTDIAEFDPAAGAWRRVKRLDGSMVLNLRVAGDRLHYACFSGATSTVGTFDGREWGEIGKLPAVMLHGMDVAVHDGKVWWAGSWRPTTRDEILKDPRAALGVGKIFCTSDGGVTWTETFKDTEGGRIQDLVVYKGALYANRRGSDLMKWSGTAWEMIPLELPTKKGEKAMLGDSQLIVLKDALLAVNPVCVYRYDGSKWSSTAPGFLKAWVDGTTAYALRDDGHVHSSSDGQSWKKLTDAGAPKELFSKKAGRGWTIRRGSVALFGGRLFIGAGSEGRILSSAPAASGTMISPPRKAAGGTRLEWEAKVPEGAKLTLAVRTASSADALPNAPWGPESGSAPLTPGAPAGHAWIQYRATFGSDGKASAALTAVRWTP